MFLKPTLSINDWKLLMAIIDKYGVNYLIDIFNRLTKLHQKDFGLNNFIYTMYGDQRSSNSRFFNDNEELFRKLTKAGISFNTIEGNIYFQPKKWMPVNLFLNIMKYEIEIKNWTIEKYMDVLNKLEEFHFDDISIDRNDWIYPHNYKSTLSYLLSNADGFMSIRKIYSDAEIYVKEENPSLWYSLPKGYTNTIWKYLLNDNYKDEATWYLIVEIENLKKVQTTLCLRSLAIDISELPKINEIESMNFAPTRVYKIDN